MHCICEARNINSVFSTVKIGKMKVAVTGATGHVGTNVCRALLTSGYDVKAMYYSRREMKALKGLAVEKQMGDILNVSSLCRLFQGCEVVIHLAAKISIDGDKDGSVYKTNVQGVQNVVDACVQSGVKRLIHFSSIHSFQQAPFFEELNEKTPYVTREAFAYDYSKAEGKRVAFSGVQQGLEVVVINPTGIIGPNDYFNSFMGTVFVNIYKQKMPAVVDGGFNWVDVRDVANAAVSAITKGVAGEEYIISGKWATVNELVKIASETTGKRRPPVVLPIWVARSVVPFARFFSWLTNAKLLFTHESLAALQFNNRKISNDKARKDLNYNPRSLKDSIKDIYAWYKTAGVI